MTEVSLDESSERLRMALPLMAQNKVPVTPENYWVWYQYVAGESQQIREAIDKKFDANKLVDQAATQALYKQYLEDPSQTHLSSAEESVRKLLESIADSLNSADSEVSRYEASLGECVEELSDDISSERLKDMVTALTESTQRMHEGSSSLHASLDESRNEVKSLRAELELVKAQAKIDPLTKLANRVGLESGLEAIRELPEAASAQHTLLIADLDRFKNINDTYGHIFGDKILKVVAKTIQALTKGADIAARFGGEEFIVVLPHADLQRGMAAAEALRRNIENGRIVNPKTKKEIESVTISLGVAEFSIDEDIYAVVERADEALYRAKENGRNRVEVASQEAATEVAVANG